MTNPLEIRLIGELEVLRDGNAIALPASKKSRALLAYLVATSKPQLRDRLCELLWDGPDDPRAALRWSLTKLRPLLDDDDAQRLIADRDRIEFSASGARVDLHELRELTSRGVGAMTSGDLRQAAAIIRGELLDGLDLANCYRYQQWCAGEREALRQLHIRILGRLADVLPPGDDALVYARRRVSVDPFNEEAHIAIMRLLAAMDRNHDALRHYDDCRALFERELGCRPSNALEDARRAIGRTQPARVVAPAPPAIVDAGSDLSFIGREAELRVVDEAIQAVFDQKKARVLVIKGEPGIGKSRLLAELRRRAEARGAATVYGRAFAAEMVRPYGVWVDALRSVIDQVP
ncbi:MAG: BTAD domain-containing putative transcriptional regulator, partial [Thermoanaerobaculia bacterium]